MCLAQLIPSLVQLLLRLVRLPLVSLNHVFSPLHQSHHFLIPPFQSQFFYRWIALLTRRVVQLLLVVLLIYVFRAHVRRNDIGKTTRFLLVTSLLNCRVRRRVRVITWVVVPVSVLPHCNQGNRLLSVISRGQRLLNSLLLIHIMRLLIVPIVEIALVPYHIRIREVILQIEVSQCPIVVIVSILVTVVIIQPYIPLTVIMILLSDLKHFITLQIVNLSLQIQLWDLSPRSFTINVLLYGLLRSLLTVLVRQRGLFQDLIALQVHRFVQIQSQVLYPHHLVEYFWLLILHFLGIILQDRIGIL